MKKINFLLAISVLLATTLFSYQKSFCAVFRVNNNPTLNQYIGQKVFANLDSAVRIDPSVHPHDTLYVEASGTAYGNIIVSKPLVIIGTGYFLNSNTGLQNNQTPSSVLSITFNAGSAGSVLCGISVEQNPGSSRIHINESNLLIERCYIRDGINFVYNSNGLSNITIKQCYNAGGLIYNIGGSFCSSVNNLIISNCYFGDVVRVSSGATLNNYTGTISQCVFNAGVVGWSSSLTYQNNIIKAGTFNQNTVNSIGNVQCNLFEAASVPSWLTGGTNKARASNVFISAPSLDLSLMQNDSLNCPECYQGCPSGTGTMGMYGGSDPYILSGIPNIPTIYFLQSPSNGFQGDSVLTHISTRSNN